MFLNNNFFYVIKASKQNFMFFFLHSRSLFLRSGNVIQKTNCFSTQLKHLFIRNRCRFHRICRCYVVVLCQNNIEQ